MHIYAAVIQLTARKPQKPANRRASSRAADGVSSLLPAARCSRRPA